MEEPCASERRGQAGPCVCGAAGALTLDGGEAGAPRPAGEKSVVSNGFPSFGFGGGRGDAAASQRAMPDLGVRV